MGNNVRVDWSRGGGQLDVQLERPRSGRDPIRLNVKDLGRGRFSCGHYELDAVESHSSRICWVDRRARGKVSIWERVEASSVGAGNAPLSGRASPPRWQPQVASEHDGRGSCNRSRARRSRDVLRSSDEEGGGRSRRSRSRRRRRQSLAGRGGRDRSRHRDRQELHCGGAGIDSGGFGPGWQMPAGPYDGQPPEPHLYPWGQVPVGPHGGIWSRESLSQPSMRWPEVPKPPPAWEGANYRPDSLQNAWDCSSSGQSSVQPVSIWSGVTTPGAWAPPGTGRLMGEEQGPSALREEDQCNPGSGHLLRKFSEEDRARSSARSSSVDKSESRDRVVCLSARQGTDNWHASEVAPATSDAAIAPASQRLGGMLEAYDATLLQSADLTKATLPPVGEPSEPPPAIVTVPALASPAHEQGLGPSTAQEAGVINTLGARQLDDGMAISEALARDPRRRTATEMPTEPPVSVSAVDDRPRDPRQRLASSSTLAPATVVGNTTAGDSADQCEPPVLERPPQQGPETSEISGVAAFQEDCSLPTPTPISQLPLQKQQEDQLKQQKYQPTSHLLQTSSHPPPHTPPPHTPPPQRHALLQESSTPQSLGQQQLLQQRPQLQTTEMSLPPPVHAPLLPLLPHLTPHLAGPPSTHTPMRPSMCQQPAPPPHAQLQRPPPQPALAPACLQQLASAPQRPPSPPPGGENAEERRRRLSAYSALLLGGAAPKEEEERAGGIAVMTPKEEEAPWRRQKRRRGAMVPLELPASATS